MSSDEEFEGYSPPSYFLCNFDWETVPLSGSEYADHNRRRLIKLMWDADKANRDWATFYLATSEIDSAEVREALLRAAADEDEDVRAEAIVGLAKRDRAIALPYIVAALAADDVGTLIFEAAAFCALPALVEALEQFEIGHDPVPDDIASALKACRSGIPIEF